MNTIRCMAVFMCLQCAVGVIVDLAVHKPCWCGPTIFQPYVCSRGNDGNPTSATIFHGDYVTYPPSWWLVDLETVANSVTGQIQTYYTLEEETIDVFPEDPRDMADWPCVAGTVCDKITAGSYEYFTCPDSAQVRYVRVVSSSRDANSYYGIYNFVVMGNDTGVTNVGSGSADTGQGGVAQSFYTFKGVEAHKPGGHVAASEIGITSNRMTCARHLKDNSDMDGFEWDPDSKVCYLYNDAETLRELVEKQEKENNLDLYVWYSEPSHTSTTTQTQQTQQTQQLQSSVVDFC